MSGIDNLFQEETLLSNIKIAAYFILLYEHFEDVVISTVKEFYAHDCVLSVYASCAWIAAATGHTKL